METQTIGNEGKVTEMVECMGKYNRLSLKFLKFCFMVEDKKCNTDTMFVDVIHKQLPNEAGRVKALCGGKFSTFLSKW